MPDIPEEAVTEAALRLRRPPVSAGMPVQLGVRCDGPGCSAHFEGDFMVAEDSTRIERLGVVLHWVEQHGWRVIWNQPIWDSVTYCPSCSRSGAGAATR